MFQIIECLLSHVCMGFVNVVYVWVLPLTDSTYKQQSEINLAWKSNKNKIKIFIDQQWAGWVVHIKIKFNSIYLVGNKKFSSLLPQLC